MSERKNKRTKAAAVNHEAVLATRAGLNPDGPPVASNECERCEEPLVFALRDKNHDFSMGLSTVLKCLKLAEKEGAVPKLPLEWWWEVEACYRIDPILKE